MITLPWPPKELNPNNKPVTKAGAMAKHRKAQEYKEDCWIITKAAKIPKPEGNVKLDIVFYPPDNRKRDLDNMLASIKYGLDGVAAGLGIDDNRFELSIKVADQIGGMVKIAISDAG